MPGRDFEKQMESVIRLFLPLFVAILLGLAPHEPALAFDGHDGGFDGAWDNDHDGGEDAASHDSDEDGENSHAGHNGAEGRSHHAQDDPHHERRPTGRDDDARHHEKGASAWGFGPGFGFGFGGFGSGGLGLGGFGGPGFGAFGYGTPYYPPSYYDSRPAYNPLLYPPLIFQSAPPPVYIQKQNAAQPVTGAQAGYWHYCREPEGYYPQVQECPDGWEPVAPQAPEVSVPDSRK